MRLVVEELADSEDTVIARSYLQLQSGPFDLLHDKVKSVRFTKSQVEAIKSGMSPGLTLIIGPPGTGKTDVAVQIIANLYHNNPNERTLIITKSNQALNQLFEKIATVDINPRHLLRLGHGEEDLESGDWSKSGRVNSFLAQRIELLKLVDRLSQSLNISGAHGNTCETAEYFFGSRVFPIWQKYHNQLESLDAAEIVASFPFTAFFNSIGWPPIFINTSSTPKPQLIKTAETTFRYIQQQIFKPLNQLRPFEILKTQSDRMEYMLLNEARIVAMTCTHAAIKRRELLRCGFRFDSIVMEEAGQMLEIETLIPVLLQAPMLTVEKTLKTTLKRLVLIGDDSQLPPVVKNKALATFAGLNQSLFARFVRMGTKTCLLDRQGRCRESIADLFRWKYGVIDGKPKLSDLGDFEGSRLANPGFAFEFQVVDVPDFNGRGESEPFPHFVQNEGEAEFVVA
ncbi:hypothetical protein HK096_010824, partial [Nowakowskiella sp. JEL0078]